MAERPIAHYYAPSTSLASSVKEIKPGAKLAAQEMNKVKGSKDFSRVLRSVIPKEVGEAMKALLEEVRLQITVDVCS